MEEQIKAEINRAKSDSERILLIGRLSEYYYANKEFTKADGQVEKQIMMAEASLSQRLVLHAYFWNRAILFAGTATKERSNTTRLYIERALAYAKSNDLADYTAFAYANLAAINSADGRLDEALKNANLAFTTALNTENDSAKVVCAVQLGNIYEQRSDILMAFKTFTNAQNIAIQNTNDGLLPMVYHAIGSLYQKLKKNETAKKYIHQSLSINKKIKNINSQIADNIFLAKLNSYTLGKNYLETAILLADSVKNPLLKIEAEKILFFHMLMKEKPAFMLSYLESKPELKNVFSNTGPNYLNWMLAEIYFYGGQPDSALRQFEIAEPSFDSKYDLRISKSFFAEFAGCYEVLKNTPLAIRYFEKAFALYRASSDLRGLKSSSNELKVLYQQQGDFEQAFTYSLLYDNYKDSVDMLGRERDLVLLEIENVSRQQLREAEIAKEKQRRKFNLQYMLITIVVATAFVLLIMIGMFKVSTFTIRLMGFLSLIFFFEFIILLLDTWIHHLTHGEPWKIWIIKIGIISIILPVHHFLEHKLIHYLLSRHLIKLRGKLSITRFFQRKKIPLQDPKENEGVLQEEKII